MPFAQSWSSSSEHQQVKIAYISATGYFMIVMIQTESFPLEIQSIGAGAI